MRALYSIKKAVDDSESMIASFKPVFIIIAIAVIQALVGKMLWNKALVPAISVVKPLKHWYDVIAISLLVSLITPTVALSPM